MTAPVAPPDIFDAAFNVVIGVEGNFDNSYDDRGNWTSGEVGVGRLLGTKFGISAAEYPSLDIVNLTLDKAKTIYRTDYWNRAACGTLPHSMAMVVFDAAVNEGVSAAIVLLQTAAMVDADGNFGPITKAAVAAADLKSLFCEFTAQRLLAYTQYASFSEFGLGWMRRITTVTYAALVLIP